MSFSKMIKLLQKKNNGTIVIINSGAFYVARGKDAVLLNQELGLKINCMEAEVCKVGFPLASIDKYTKLIEEKGLEIGNYTSQTFANIYLNEVDQFVKHKLHIKYYFRFMDDSVILVESKKEAKECLEKIRKFLKENLDLELNSKTQIFKSRQGVNFCGYKINEYRLKIRDKGKRKLKKKIKELKYKIKTEQITSKEAHKYLAGHLGYIKIANTKNLEKRNFYIE